jgi:hypothetical protein
MPPSASAYSATPGASSVTTRRPESPASSTTSGTSETGTLNGQQAHLAGRQLVAEGRGVQHPRLHAHARLVRAPPHAAQQPEQPGAAAVGPQQEQEFRVQHQVDRPLERLQR